MNITLKAPKLQFSAEMQALLEAKLAAPLRLLGEDGESALIDVEITSAPAEGRSSEPYRLVARLSVGNDVYHAEAVKPTPESAADMVRSELEAEIRKSRGRSRSLLRRGRSAIKKMLRFGN